MTLSCMECNSFAEWEVVKPVGELSDPWGWSNLDSMVGKPYPGSILAVGKPYPGSILAVGLEGVAVARQKKRLVHLMVAMVVGQEVVSL